MHLAVAQEVRRSLGHHRRNLDLMRIIGRIDRQLMAAAGYGDRDERHRGDEQAASGHCDIRNVQTRRFAIVSACAQLAAQRLHHFFVGECFPRRPVEDDLATVDGVEPTVRGYGRQWRGSSDWIGRPSR